MKQIIILIICLLWTSTHINAQEKLNKNKSIEFSVSGNCEMCKKRIEKAAYSIKGVKIADWHIDHKDIKIIFNETKCSSDDIKKAIAKAGHDTDTIKATDEDYKKLHHCCLYRNSDENMGE